MADSGLSDYIAIITGEFDSPRMHQATRWISQYSFESEV